MFNNIITEQKNNVNQKRTIQIDILFFLFRGYKMGGHDQPLSRTPRKKDIFIITTVKHLSNLRGPFLKFIFLRKILRILWVLTSGF